MIPKPVISFFLYLVNLETEQTPWESEELLFCSSDIPIQASTCAAEPLKSKLSVIEYKSFVKKKGNSLTVAAECAICLQFMEARDHVRELKNCCHAFHVACMDRWLDLGRFSCPLCRSAVAPVESGRRGPLSFLKRLLGSLVRGC